MYDKIWLEEARQRFDAYRRAALSLGIRRGKDIDRAAFEEWRDLLLSNATAKNIARKLKVKIGTVAFLREAIFRTPSQKRRSDNKKVGKKKRWGVIIKEVMVLALKKGFLVSTLQSKGPSRRVVINGYKCAIQNPQSPTVVFTQNTVKHCDYMIVAWDLLEARHWFVVPTARIKFYQGKAIARPSYQYRPYRNAAPRVDLKRFEDAWDQLKKPKA